MTRDETAGLLIAVGRLMQREHGREFDLIRHEDVSGVSGVGPIAHGERFVNGIVRLDWPLPWNSTAVWPSLDKLLGAHGHSGRTVAEWLDGEET